MNRTGLIFNFSFLIALLLGLTASSLPLLVVPATTFTVAGTIRDSGGTPVPDTWIGIRTLYEWRETTTAGDGTYSVQVNGPTHLDFHIVPPVETRLAWKGIRLEGPFNSNTVQDFTLVDGYLFSGVVRSPAGVSTYLPWRAKLIPLLQPLPANEWFDFYTQWRNGNFQIVLPPDVYSIIVRDPPRPAYPTRVTVDLRSADVTGYDLYLSAAPQVIPGAEPPDASAISLSAPDSKGFVDVIGGPGAVTPFASVFVGHLETGRFATDVAGEDGSFSASVYAPPGSSVIIKQDPTAEYVRSFVRNAVPDPNNFSPIGASILNPLASTVLRVPETTTVAGRGDRSSRAGPLATQDSLQQARDDRSGEPFAAVGIVNPNKGVAPWTAEGRLVVERTFQQATDGTLDGKTVSGLYAGGFHWTKPALADIDADGDLDLFVGEQNGHIVHYRNDGGTWTFVTDKYDNMDIDWWVTPAFVDIDNDGDLDLLAGSGTGRITFFRNIGTPTTAAWRYVTDYYEQIDVGSHAAPAFADIDADGDYDLFVGSDRGTVAFIRNVGTPENALWQYVTADVLNLEVGWLALPALADIDADGDLDMFVGTWGKIVHFRNDGTPQAAAWTLAALGYGPFEQSAGGLMPAFADLDGDTDLDVLMGWEWGALQTWANVGSPASAAWSLADDDTCPWDLGGYSTPALADWDADGDLDLLVGVYDGRVLQMRNLGTAAQPAWTQVGQIAAVNPNGRHRPAPTLVDIDADDDLDLFVGWDNGTVDYLRNIGTRWNPRWTLTAQSYAGIDVGNDAKPAFGDIDGDGDYDLFIGERDGTINSIRNTGTPASPAWAAPQAGYGDIDVGRYSAPILLDLDADTDLDMLVGEEGGRIFEYHNDGGSWALAGQSFGGLAVDGHAAPASGDLNGDQQTDLMVGSLAGGLKLYQNRGDAPLDPLSVEPGGVITARGVLRITSEALTPGFDTDSIYVGGSFGLHPFFDAEGRPHSVDNQFRSTFLTPSGFAIERFASWYNPWRRYFKLTDVTQVDDHTLEAPFEITLNLPDDLPAGHYRPALKFYFDNIPMPTNEALASVSTFNRPNNIAFLPMLRVGQPATPHLPWMLLADTHSNGTRGTGALEDADSFGLANRITAQAATFFVPLADARSGTPFTYRLEPYVPFLSLGDRALPHAPLIPFDFASGQLHVQVRKPDGSVDDLGTAPITQSASRTPTLHSGYDMDNGGGNIADIYQLVTGSGQFDYQFTQYGRHVITMTGSIADPWGYTYTGGGTYEVIVGHEIDLDPGALPATPFQAGDALAPTVRMSPPVPADVTLRLRLWRNSDPNDVVEQVVTGTANPFGYFHPSAQGQSSISNLQSPISLPDPGEYRVDVTALYTDTTGAVWVGSQSWGNVVESPGTRLVAHGRRGIDATFTRLQWFHRSQTGVSSGHVNFPFSAGDVLWVMDGDASIPKVSFHDPSGTISEIIREQAAQTYPNLSGPGSLENQLAMGETPLFSVAQGPSDPGYTLNDMEQWGYTYRIVQRPDVSVRYEVTEDSIRGAYWRFGDQRGSQLGMGILGDEPKDIKWQFGGVVFRDVIQGLNKYAIYGSLWVELPDDDPQGSRVFPPFQGAAGGPSGGPIMKLKGEDIDLLIVPTGVRPGAILEVGDTFAFAGQVGPPLDSRVDVVVTSPSGVTREIHGRANKVGYFYEPEADFVVDEAGVWAVDVTVTHDGMTSAGPVEPPYPTGSVLGAPSGRYQFYVVNPASPRATVLGPAPGWLPFDWKVEPVQVVGQVPEGWTDVQVDYTITMPGWVLEAGTVTPDVARSGDRPQRTFTITYDPEALSQEFPNIDLRRQYSWAPGLVDEVFISFAVTGSDGGVPVTRANVVTLRGEQVFVEGYESPALAPIPTPVGTMEGEGRTTQGIARLAGGSQVIYLPLVALGYEPGGGASPGWCQMTSHGLCIPTDQVDEPPPPSDVEVDPNQDSSRVR